MARTIRNTGAGSFRTARNVKQTRKQSQQTRKNARTTRVDWRGNQGE